MTELQIQASQLFSQLVQGLCMVDLMKIAKRKAGRPPVYIYDALTRNVEIPHPLDIPWLVRYLLGHHHKKYTFANNTIPNIQQVHIATQHWCRKRVWQLRLEGEESEDPDHETPRRKLN